MIVWTLFLVFSLHNGDQLRQRVETYSTLRECIAVSVEALETMKGRKVKAQCISLEGALL
jgi:hypothetical protein